MSARRRILNLSLTVVSLCWLVAGLSIPVAAADDLRDARTWTDRNGNELSGKYSGIIRDQLLLRTDGRVIRVPLEHLSEQDLTWLRARLNEKNQLNKLPAEFRTGPMTVPASDPPATPGTSPKTPDPAPPGNPAVTPNVPDSSDRAMPAETDAAKYDKETVRTWTDLAGQQTEARLQVVVGDDAILKMSDGSIARVPLKNLSAEDQEWIYEYHRRNDLLSRLPREYQDGPPEPAASGTATTVTGRPTRKIDMIRQWTDRKENTMTARFLNVQDDDVTFQTERRRMTVPLAQLSLDDLEWLQEALREEGRLTELPLPFRDPQDRKMSELQLIRHRRNGYFRKWTTFVGKSFVGQYDSVRDGQVLIKTTEGPREVPVEDLSDEDVAFLKERLGREVPADFFSAEDVTPPTDGTSRVWTDRAGHQQVGTFVRLDKNGTVAILKTPDGEQGFVYEFFDDDDQAEIRGEVKKQEAEAKAARERAIAERNQRMNQLASQGPTYRGPGSGMSANPGSAEPSGPRTPRNPGFRRDPMFNHGQPNHPPEPPSFPDIQVPEPPKPPEIAMPRFEWVMKCDRCGKEFDESSGLKQGDECPNCKQQNQTYSMVAVAVVLIGIGVAVFRKAFG